MSPGFSSSGSVEITSLQAPYAKKKISSPLLDMLMPKQLCSFGHDTWSQREPEQSTWEACSMILGMQSRASQNKGLQAHAGLQRPFSGCSIAGGSKSNRTTQARGRWCALAGRDLPAEMAAFPARAVRAARLGRLGSFHRQWRAGVAGRVPVVVRPIRKGGPHGLQHPVQTGCAGCRPLHSPAWRRCSRGLCSRGLCSASASHQLEVQHADIEPGEGDFHACSFTAA